MVVRVVITLSLDLGMTRCMEGLVMMKYEPREAMHWFMVETEMI